MRQKKSPKWYMYLLALAVGIASYYNQQKEELHAQTTAPAPSPQGTKGGVTQGEYDVLEDCTLVERSRNDGDSFFVQHAEGVSEFRLYYVDSPESAYKEYRNGENNGQRLDQQADYFAIDRTGAIKIGQSAKHFALRALAAQPFTVYTKWEGVYGPERQYAFIRVGTAGSARFLHELLVEQGMARIHTKPATMPNGTSVQQQTRHLRALEAKAKAEGLGAWAP